MACQTDEHEWETRTTPGGKTYKVCLKCGKAQT